MKSTDFIKILKEVIKREVRSVIREELTTALKPSVTESKHKPTTKKLQQSSPTHSSINDIISNTAIENSPIKDILKETAMSMQSGASQGILEEEGWQDMGGMMTADQAQGFGHMTQQSNLSQQVAPSSTDAFIKDYSQVLQSSYDKTPNR
jgi:hypothetical protein